MPIQYTTRENMYTVMYLEFFGKTCATQSATIEAQNASPEQIGVFRCAVSALNEVQKWNPRNPMLIYMSLPLKQSITHVIFLCKNKNYWACNIKSVPSMSHMSDSFTSLFSHHRHTHLNKTTKQSSQHAKISGWQL